MADIICVLDSKWADIKRKIDREGRLKMEEISVFMCPVASCTKFPCKLAKYEEKKKGSFCWDHNACAKCHTKTGWDDRLCYDCDSSKKTIKIVEGQ